MERNRQTTIFDFLEDADYAIKTAMKDYKEFLDKKRDDGPDIDETPTNVDFKSYMASQGVEPIDHTPKIEKVINSFLDNVPEGELPSTEAAQVIVMLDSVLKGWARDA